MCLTRISEYLPDPEGFGYQVVLKNSRNYPGFYRGIICRDLREPGVWTMARRDREAEFIDSTRPEYEPGFHVLAAPHRPQFGTLVRIRYRGARVQGPSRPCQFFRNDDPPLGRIFTDVWTIVADETMILEEVCW